MGLGNDGDLSTRQAAATIRLAINKVPQIWKDGRVSLGSLWGLCCQYPYMPRLRDRSVLNEGVYDLPMLRQVEAFALAAGYDKAANRYTSLWIPGDTAPAPTATDALLLVRPDVAQAQRDQELADAPQPGDQPADTPPVSEHFEPDPTQPGVYHRKTKTRFYGVKTLNSDRIALDVKNIVDEIIANLRDPNTELSIKLEIEATRTTGFEETKVRTLSENAQTLKFDQSGFEEK